MSSGQWLKQLSISFRMRQIEKTYDNKSVCLYLETLNLKKKKSLTR